MVPETTLTDWRVRILVVFAIVGACGCGETESPSRESGTDSNQRSSITNQAKPRIQDTKRVASSDQVADTVPQTVPNAGEPAADPKRQLPETETGSEGHEASLVEAGKDTVDVAFKELEAGQRSMRERLKSLLAKKELNEIDSIKIKEFEATLEVTSKKLKRLRANKDLNSEEQLERQVLIQAIRLQREQESRSVKRPSTKDPE